jgi:hypothetical protein
MREFSNIALVLACALCGIGGFMLSALPILAVIIVYLGGVSCGVSVMLRMFARPKNQVSTVN